MHISNTCIILSVMYITDLPTAMTAQYENPVVEYRNGLVGKWWESKKDNQDGDGEEGPSYLKSQSSSHIQRNYFSYYKAEAWILT